MSNFLGCGTHFYGHLDERTDGSYITTKWIIIFYIAIFPLKSSRVIKESSSTNQSGYYITSSTLYSIIDDSLNINVFQVIFTYIVFLLPILFAILFFYSFTIDHSGRNKFTETLLGIFGLITIIASPGISFIYAKKANRNPIGWAVGGLILAYIIPFILVIFVPSQAGKNRSRIFIKNELIFKSIKKGNIKKAAKLIEDGIDLNTVDLLGYTPLCNAAYYGNIKIAELLIEKGADINKGNTPPVIVAVANNHFDLAVFLIEKGVIINKNELLTAAVKECRDKHDFHKDEIKCGEFVAFLIGKGADVNTEDKFQATPLRLAISNGLKNIIELLLKNGVNVSDEIDYAKKLYNKTNKIKIKQNYLEIIKLLEDAKNIKK